MVYQYRMLFTEQMKRFRSSSIIKMELTVAGTVTDSHRIPS